MSSAAASGPGPGISLSISVSLDELLALGVALNRNTAVILTLSLPKLPDDVLVIFPYLSPQISCKKVEEFVIILKEKERNIRSLILTTH